MSRNDATAMALCLLAWACLVPMYFHHYLPVACWLSAWAVCVVTKPKEAR